MIDLSQSDQVRKGVKIYEFRKMDTFSAIFKLIIF